MCSFDATDSSLVFTNTPTEGSLSGNHPNKQGVCTHLCKVRGPINNGRVVGINNDDHVHAREGLPTFII